MRIPSKRDVRPVIRSGSRQLWHRFQSYAIGTGGITIGLVVAGLFLSVPAAWLTHVVICFQHGQWGFLLVGALFFPLALIHGYGHWLGLW